MDALADLILPCLHTSLCEHMLKNLGIGTPKIITGTVWFCNADGMVNNVDPDQTAPKRAVWSAQSDLHCWLRHICHISYQF